MMRAILDENGRPIPASVLCRRHWVDRPERAAACRRAEVIVTFEDEAFVIVKNGECFPCSREG